MVAAFSALRELERWLHRHIFKVGWLVTQNFQTTTILYYTFFLPGLFVNQLMIWLVAGMLDVRAERAISWPEKQEIGSLRLDFVRISKKAGPLRTAIIEIAPLLGGIFIVWFVANNILNVGEAFSVADGTLSSFNEAISRLTSAPAFWLWIYFMFTVANAMMPDPKIMRGWVWGVAVFTGIVGFLFLAGFGNEAINAGFFEPIINSLNGLTGVFGLIIVLDLLAVGFLGLVESTIEWLTGASATFENGKMVTMTRQEAIERRRASRKKSTPAALRAPSGRGQIPALTGQPSIYKFEFPTPGPPGKEPVSQSATSIVDSDDKPEQQPLAFDRPPRIEPDVITSTATRTTGGDDENEGTEDHIDSRPKTTPFARTGGPVIRTPSSLFHEEKVDRDDPGTIDNPPTTDDLPDDDDDVDSDDADDITYEDFENPA